MINLSFLFCDEQARQLEEHLKACPACRKKLEETMDTLKSEIPFFKVVETVLEKILGGKNGGK